MIQRVHLRAGFWNSKGGIAYALTLGLGATALYLAAPGAPSLDRTLGWSFSLPIQITALAAALVGAGAALLWSSPARNRRPAHA